LHARQFPGQYRTEQELAEHRDCGHRRTISGKAATGTQAGYTSGAITIDAMLAAVPEIKALANDEGEQISNVG